MSRTNYRLWDLLWYNPFLRYTLFLPFVILEWALDDITNFMLTVIAVGLIGVGVLIHHYDVVDQNCLKKIEPHYSENIERCDRLIAEKELEKYTFHLQISEMPDSENFMACRKNHPVCVEIPAKYDPSIGVFTYQLKELDGKKFLCNKSYECYKEIIGDPTKLVVEE